MAKKAITPQAIAGITNIEFWNMARAKNPNFASHTAKGTADIFSEKGFESLKRDAIGTLNEFFELSMRVAFQKVDISRARNPLASVGLVEVYDTPNGGFTQRIAINSIKPVSPAFHNLQDGVSVDPFVVRKPTDNERFFGQNFDYQSFITIQDFQVKQIFISDFGMGEFIAGIMQGLENGYVLQEYTNTKECINAGINSTEYPLQNTQKIGVTSWSDNPTDAELKEFILTLKDLATAMQTQAQTGMYNANGFETYVDVDDYVVLMRAGIKNRIALNLEIGAFNPETLSIPFDTTEISDFGGLVPYSDSNFTTRVYPKYNDIGERVAYNTAEDGTGTDVADNAVYWKDENAEVLAIVAQKGWIFENKQNPYSVQPIYNPRGMYNNYWCNSPNNSVNVDPNYNVIVITKPQG